MEFLQPYMSSIYIAGGALLLFIAVMILLRLFGKSVRGRKGSRLGISEYYEIDKSRRLVLVRRDDVEHLLLIGGAQDLVVEIEIGSPLMQPESVTPMRQAPRPAVFGNRRPTLRPVEGSMRPHREEPEM